MKHLFQECREIISNLAPLNAECDPEFASEISRFSRTGLWLASLFAFVGPAIGMAAFIALGGALQFLPELGQDAKPFAADALIIALGLAGLLLSSTALGARHGRLIVAMMATLMFAGSSLEASWYGLATLSPPFLGVNFIMLMLICVGTMPYQFWQTALLGGSMAGAYFLSVKIMANAHGIAESPAGAEDTVFFFILTLFSMGISALLYGARYRLLQSRKEEKLLRQKTAISEHKYRSLFEDSTDAIFVIDNNTSKFVEVNHAFEELLNRPAEDLYEINFLEVIAPEDRDKVVENRRRRLQGEDIPLRYPLNILQKESPEPIICDLTVHQGGDPNFSTGALRDITEVVKSKERVERLAHIPEENPNPVIRCDYDGKITYMNPSARGLTAELGVPDIPIEGLLPRDFLQEVQRSIDTGETIMFQLHKAHEHTFSITYNPHPGAREVYVWMMDVTERVKAFDKIRSYAEELESKNREIEDTRIQLVQSEKMAALGNLVAGVAHEINTPLGAINSNVDISERALKQITELVCAGSCTMTDEVRDKTDKTMAVLGEITATMRIAVERIVQIVRSLRNFARLDEAERKPADLHEGIDSTLTLLTHEFKNRITIEKNYGTLPMVDCFPNQLNQVFMNILMNASQAIEGKGTITITTSHNNGDVKLQFADSGAGIKESDLQRIYDPGFTTKGVGVGTGLGLSIVYRIIQQHNGTIDVQSAPGEGTTVTVTIPIEV